MVRYMVRVELHGAESNEYEKLHESMESIGLYKTLLSDTRRPLKLPQGTYQGESNLSAKELCFKVLKVASPLSKGSPSIIACALAGDWEAWLSFADR
ncbi:hypothetical protein AB204_08960 [Xenorhabdus khoisanae]|uniref:DUF2622 domain-containing protein n=1 Tax=Xenorhabdus khoisanae TaxID=880157 RepID=A0A0J5FT14_9GAMM|nr:hypothetical protein AB204_08960 [Xenorhabdus khoisanae]